MRRLLVMLILVVTVQANASPTFYGTVTAVTRPDAVLIETDDAFLELKLFGVLLPQKEGVSCENHPVARARCEYLEQKVLGERVGVIVERFAEEKFYGDIVTSQQSIVVALVRAGLFRVDKKQHRPTYLLDAEKDAMCSYRGLWEVYLGDPRMVKKCQSLL